MSVFSDPSLPLSQEDRAFLEACEQTPPPTSEDDTSLSPEFDADVATENLVAAVGLRMQALVQDNRELQRARLLVQQEAAKTFYLQVQLEELREAHAALVSENARLASRLRAIESPPQPRKVDGMGPKSPDNPNKIPFPQGEVFTAVSLQRARESVGAWTAHPRVLAHKIMAGGVAFVPSLRVVAVAAEGAHTVEAIRLARVAGRFGSEIEAMLSQLGSDFDKSEAEAPVTP